MTYAFISVVLILASMCGYDWKHNKGEIKHPEIVFPLGVLAVILGCSL